MAPAASSGGGGTVKTTNTKRRKVNGGKRNNGHKKKQTGDEDVQVPKEDLVMKLSAELRNKIYEEVLLPAIKQRGTRFECQTVTVEVGKWKEPGLLQASRQIRAETWQMYYDRHSFQLRLRGDQFQQVRLWMDSRVSHMSSVEVEESECRALHSITFQLQQLRWRQVKAMLPLARLLEVYASVPPDVDIKFKNLFDHSNKHNGIRKAMREVFEFGLQAMREGWHPERLRGHFEGWLQGTCKGDAKQCSQRYSNRRRRNQSLDGDESS